MVFLSVEVTGLCLDLLSDACSCGFCFLREKLVFFCLNWFSVKICDAFEVHLYCLFLICFVRILEFHSKL